MIKSPSSSVTYADAGVNIDAGNALVERIKPQAMATARGGVMGGLGGFGALFDLKAAGFHDPILVSTTDGVGTKLKIAQEAGNHTTIGIDLVAMCVNDLVVQGADPLFFLDYFATGKLEVDVAEAVIAGIAKGCTQAGCALVGGETAEMPGMYAPGEYDLAGFAVGAAERGSLLPSKDIRAGDVLIGLASSGVHSNGYSLVRHIVARGGYDYAKSAPFDAAQTLGDALLTPTRIYVKSTLAAIRAGGVKALAHITGGGLTENIPRVLPAGISAHIEVKTLPQLPVLQWLKAEGNLENAEYYRTFNCGVGMVLAVDAARADALCALLNQADEQAVIIGELQPRAGDAVVIHG